MSTMPPISSLRSAPLTFCSSPAASICASQSRRSGFAMFTSPRCSYKNGTYMIFEILRAFLRIAALALPLAAAAADYPTKPVRLIVPFAPGGGNDLLARLLSMQLADALGQQVIVDNRPGAAGITATELFKNATGIDMVHVPYKGAGPATTAVLAGEAQVLFGSISSSLSYARANRLVALAVTSPKRSPLAPELPTLLESGIADVDVPS